MAPQETQNHFGSGRILIMEDEETIRDILGTMLNIMGYTVEYAPDGNEVIERVKKSLQSGDRIKAVIMDLTIPEGVGGQEAISGIRDIDKYIQVFVTSGYSDHPIMIDPQAFGFNDKIPKPFTYADLVVVFNRNLK